MANIVQELLQGERQFLEKLVTHADFLRVYGSPVRRVLNPSVVVCLKEGDDLGFAVCRTHVPTHHRQLSPSTCRTLREFSDIRQALPLQMQS